MQRIFQIVALLLAIFWLPATSHELLESAGWIHAHDNTGPDVWHDAADGFCRTDQGPLLLKAPVLVPPLLVAIFADEITFAVEPIHFHPVGVAFASTAPPELATTWPFSRRMVGPNRAPPVLG